MWGITSIYANLRVSSVCVCAQLKARLLAALGPDAFSRVLFYPRMPNSDHFLAFLSCVDVVLHPFPFDGSKTAADALALGIPMVTWPSEYLRGRMGPSFYESMGWRELVAGSEAEYVDIAVRLGTEPAFRAKCAHAIRTLRGVIWQREEVGQCVGALV